MKARKSIEIMKLIGKPECIESNKLFYIVNFLIIRKSLMLAAFSPFKYSFVLGEIPPGEGTSQ